MMKLKSKKQINQLTLLFAATYMVSYMTRINYGAVISEMETATAFSRSLLSLAVTGSFITYGVGQIVSGIVGDRCSPKKLVFIGLCVTALMNLLIPVCQDPYQMLCVWCVNGFAQSFLWPPLVRILATMLREQDYKEAINKVAWGSSIGTIVIYLVSPVCLSVFGWKSVFVFSALCAGVMLFAWNRYACDIGVETKADKAAAPAKTSGALFTPLMFGVMIAIVMQGMLRDGVTTWMPSYISETYNLSNAIAILTGVVLPVFSILCFQVATKLYTKRLTNPLTCAGLLFCVGTVAALGLVLITGKSAGLSVFLSAVLTGCMYGVNLMLNCMIPQYFEKSGMVSTVSGVLNSCTYIGSAASTYGIALLSEKLGWNFTLLSWLVIAVLGTVICFICIKPWAHKFGR